MLEKFTVVQGGKGKESIENAELISAHKNATTVVESVARFEGMLPDLTDMARYHDQTDEELAYEAERLRQAIEDPSINVATILEQALALQATIETRIGIVPS